MFSQFQFVVFGFVVGFIKVELIIGYMTFSSPQGVHLGTVVVKRCGRIQQVEGSNHAGWMLWTCCVLIVEKLGIVVQENIF